MSVPGACQELFVVFGGCLPVCRAQHSGLGTCLSPEFTQRHRDSGHGHAGNVLIAIAFYRLPYQKIDQADGTAYVLFTRHWGRGSISL